MEVFEFMQVGHKTLLAIRESSRFHESRERYNSQISPRTKTVGNDPRPVFAGF